MLYTSSAYCLYSVNIIFSDSTHTVAAPLHMGGFKCSAWCLNRNETAVKASGLHLSIHLGKYNYNIIMLLIIIAARLVN